MVNIFPGRYAAQIDKPLVLFLIGMRINKFAAIGKWWPVAKAMPEMLRELSKQKDAGILGYNNYLWGRNLLVIQYWETFEKLLAYAHDRDGLHFPAWAAFNRAIGNDGSVGIWHETYKVEPGKFESIYVNMPRIGLAEIGRAHV